MNRLYKTTIFIFLGFIPFSGLKNEVTADDVSANIQNAVSCEVETQKDHFPTIDFKRLEQKCLSYKKLSDRSKDFRTAVYVAGAGVALGTLVYSAFKIFGHQENSAANVNASSGTQSSSSTKETDSFKNLGFGDKCWHYCQKGASKGLYYGISAMIVTAILSFQSVVWGSSKNKLFELWNGQHQEQMLKTIKLVGINFKLLKGSLDFTLTDFDTDEAKNDYALFIDFVENLIALVTHMAQDKLQKDSTLQTSILNLRDLFIARVLAFSEELEGFLKEVDEGKSEDKNSNKAELIKISFEKLGDQLVRFVNLSYSTIYEA